jgi:antitoxin (DNA-binding transcriptional repressor) of toxin-antitoxin stability system
VLACVRDSVYNTHMAVTATQLRKELFQTLDSVVRGEIVEVSYKGTLLQIAPVANLSKLSRAVKRDILMVDPQSIVESDTELQNGIEEGWRKGDKRF